MAEPDPDKRETKDHKPDNQRSGNGDEKRKDSGKQTENERNDSGGDSQSDSQG